MQTRDPRNVKFACESALAEDFFDRPCDLLEYIGYWLEAVGFTFERVKFDADGVVQTAADEILKTDVNECGDAKQAQADECDVSRANVNLNETCNAANAVKFNADESDSDKSQKAPNDKISFGGEKFRLKRYCGQRVYHIIFPREYFGAPYAAHLAKHHLTWRFEGKGRL